MLTFTVAMRSPRQTQLSALLFLLLAIPGCLEFPFGDGSLRERRPPKDWSIAGDYTCVFGESGTNRSIHSVRLDAIGVGEGASNHLLRIRSTGGGANNKEMYGATYQLGDNYLAQLSNVKAGTNQVKGGAFVLVVPEDNHAFHIYKMDNDWLIDYAKNHDGVEAVKGKRISISDSSLWLLSGVSVMDRKKCYTNKLCSLYANTAEGNRRLQVDLDGKAKEDRELREIAAANLKQKQEAVGWKALERMREPRIPPTKKAVTPVKRRVEKPAANLEYWKTFDQPAFARALYLHDLAPLYEDRLLTKDYLEAMLTIFHGEALQRAAAEAEEEVSTEYKKLQNPAWRTKLITHATLSPDYVRESTWQQVSPFLKATQSLGKAHDKDGNPAAAILDAFLDIALPMAERDVITERGVHDGAILFLLLRDSPEVTRTILEGADAYLLGGLTPSLRVHSRCKASNNRYVEDMPWKLLDAVRELSAKRTTYELNHSREEIALYLAALSRNERGEQDVQLLTRYCSELLKLMRPRTGVSGIGAVPAEYHISFLATLRCKGRLDGLQGRLRKFVVDEATRSTLATALAGHGRIEEAAAFYGGELPISSVATVYKAITKAMSKDVDGAAADYRSFMASHAREKYPPYESLRAFCLLVETLAREGGSEVALRLVEEHPMLYYQLVGKAYVAKGASRTDILQKAVAECRRRPKAENGMLAEIGIVALSMGEERVALDCLGRMSTENQRQELVSLLSELAVYSFDPTYLIKAKFYAGGIPEKAWRAREQAAVSIALATCHLNLTPASVQCALSKVSTLAPEYRVLFYVKYFMPQSDRFYRAGKLR